MAFEKVSGIGPDDHDHVEYGRGLGPHDALNYEVSDFEWGRDDARRRAEVAAHIAEILDPVIHSQTLVAVPSQQRTYV